MAREVKKSRATAKIFSNHIFWGVNTKKISS
ncbi:DUF1661 domain-containing protein [Porphyromonas gulae]